MPSLSPGCRAGFRETPPRIREMNETAIHASRTADRARARALRGMAIGVAATVVLAYLGALGTHQAPLVQRLAYWAAVIMPGSVLGLMVTALVRGWGGLAGRRWLEVAVIALAVSVPHTFLVVVASALFFGIEAITPGLVASFWSAVLVIALVLTAINHLAATGEAAVPLAAAAPLPPVPVAAPPPEPAPELADASPLPPLPELIAEKLPARLRAARLIAIEAEDHYLRIHTDAGSDLVLMRMTDACALLPEAAGARVHRSWWAARAATEAVERGGGRTELRLAGGLVVPVSRAMQAVIRAQGWG